MLSEITITYADSNTLKVLKSLAKYMHFTISEPAQRNKQDFVYVNGVPMILGDTSVDISGMEALVSKNQMDAKNLRKEAWEGNR